MSVSLQILSPDEWRLFRDLRLQALAEAPRAFGTRLAEWQGERDLEARWRARLTTVPFNAIALLDGEPAGMASGTAPDAVGACDLISMWVAPFARGRGAGDALVQAVLGYAANRGAQRVRLSVIEGNAAAIALYQRHGFSFTGAVETSPDGRREHAMERPASLR